MTPRRAARAGVIRLGLVESDPMRILGCQITFERTPAAQIVPVSITGLLDDSTIGVAILGLRPPFEELTLLPVLRSARPGLKLILMGDGLDDDAIVKAIDHGARGYLDGAASPLALRQALKAVLQGQICAPDPILARLSDRSLGKAAPGPDSITDREREVLEHLIAAKSNREIAAVLGIEERTVKSHMARLLRKAGVKNRIALSVYAIDRKKSHPAEFPPSRNGNM